MTPDQTVTDLDARVRYQVYDAAMRTGNVPRRDELAASLGCTLDEIRGALLRLADSHVLVLQPENGEVLMAAPFSAVPTAFQVSSGGRTYHGNCIWDALGIAAMLKREAEVIASCGCCGTGMQLRVHEGRLEPAPGVVHFALPPAQWWENVVFT